MTPTSRPGLAVAVLAASLLAAPPLGAGESPATQPATREAPALPAGFHTLTPDLAVGGAPKADDLEALGKAGFQTVLNLRLASEPGVAEEEKAAQAAGLSYIHVPVTPGEVDAQSYAAFRAVLEDPSKRPLVVHCASSNRVGMMLAVHAALADGKSLDDAEAKGVAAGLKSDDAKAAFRAFVERNRKP